MALGTRILPESLRSLAFGSIGASYMGIGTALDHPARILEIQNLTDGALLFSFDGIEDHAILPASGFLLLDLTANKTEERGAFVSEGTRIYVKESGTPTSGAVYVSAFYGKQV